MSNAIGVPTSWPIFLKHLSRKERDEPDTCNFRGSGISEKDMVDCEGQ